MATTVVLTNEGRQTVLRRLKGDAGYNAPSYIGWGTGSGTASATDTTLFSEASEARVAGIATVETDQNVDDTYQVVGTLTASAARTITNAGVFDSANKTDANDRLFIKASFDGMALNQGDSIQFTFRWRLN